MAGTITSANAVLMLSVLGLFPVPQLIQGFAVEDVFDSEDLETAETMMGVDGKLSAGFVFNPIKQGFTLMADSPSIALFEAVYASELAAKDKYVFYGTIFLPSVSRLYTMTRGFMTGYKPMPDAKKVLQPRKFGMTWQSIIPAVA